MTGLMGGTGLTPEALQRLLAAPPAPSQLEVVRGELQALRRDVAQLRWLFVVTWALVLVVYLLVLAVVVRR